MLAKDDDGDYRLTEKGIALWPIVRSLMAWGDAFYSPAGVKRALRHDEDGGLLDHEGRCATCGQVVPVPDTRIEPGPGFVPVDIDLDPVSQVLNTPRRLLDPVR